jgi:hypothetical protein
VIDRAGRRCAVCRTGRHWRQLNVIRRDGAPPVVMCAACRARYGDAPPQPAARVRSETVPAPAAQPTSSPPEQPREDGEDRVRRVLRELPKGEHTTGSIAKAAGINQAKALRRLEQLAAAGEIRQVGKRWSTERPPNEIDLALDRLQARSTNLRIIRDRSPVG